MFKQKAVEDGRIEEDEVFGEGEFLQLQVMSQCQLVYLKIL
jgi:hypothetical protein